MPCSLPSFRYELWLAEIAEPTLILEVQAPSQASSLVTRAWTIGPSRFILCSVANGDDARGLAEKVREVICQEWQGAGGSLQSAVVYQRLLEQGVEVPGYQMSAILNAFKVGGLITTAPPRPQREEDVRTHGDLLIRGVRSDLCNSS